ncbi:serine/threonine-protein phosphatase, partial [bacterium]|nr:serine/threonine-protein phosphatase [bacterium]
MKFLNSKISNLFLFWTLIAVGTPLVILLFYLLTLESEWERDLKFRIRENHSSMKLELENYYQGTWKRTIEETSLQALELYDRSMTPPPANQVEAHSSYYRDVQEHWNRYRLQFLRLFGVEVSEIPGSNDEGTAPVRMQVIRLVYEKPYHDYVDLLAKTIAIDRVEDHLRKSHEMDPESRVLLKKFHNTALNFLLWNQDRIQKQKEIQSDEELADSGYLEFKRFLELYWALLTDSIRFSSRYLWTPYLLHGRKIRDFKSANIDTDWDSLKSLLKPVFRAHIMGQFAYYPGYSNLFEIVTGIDIDSMVDGWFPLGSGIRSLRVMFRPLPLNSPREKYLSGRTPLPELIGAVIVKKDALARYFCRIWNAMETNSHSLSALDDSIDFHQIDQLLAKKGVLPKIKVSVADARIKDTLTQQFRKRFKSALNPQNSWNRYLGLFTETLRRLVKFLFSIQRDKDSILQRDLEWRTATTIELFHQSELNTIQNRLSRFQDSKLPMQKGILYQDSNGEKRLGHFFDSDVIADHFFFLSLPAQSAFREILIQKGIIYLVMFLALSLAIVLIRRLATQIVPPIWELTRRVDEFQPEKKNLAGEGSQRRDELGELSRSLDDMNESVGSRIRELEAVNSLNMSMLSGAPFHELIERFLRATEEILSTHLVVLSFFDAQHPTIPLMYSGSESLMDQSSESQVLEMMAGLQNQAKNWSSGIYPIFLDTFESQGFQAHNAVVLRGTEKQKEDSQFQPCALVVLGTNDPLSREQESFVMSFGSEILSLFARSRLEETRKESEKGSEQQTRAMLPDLPDLSNLAQMSATFIPARYLGGDFIDFRQSEDQNYLDLVISDVSGKGLGPGLLGATAKTYWKLLSQREKSPGAVLRQLNDLLCEENFPSLFLTIFYARINLLNGTYEYASGGHNQMIQLMESSRETVALSAKGLPLGMFEGTEYETRKGKLLPGDWLVL